MKKITPFTVLVSFIIIAVIYNLVFAPNDKAFWYLIGSLITTLCLNINISRVKKGSKTNS